MNEIDRIHRWNGERLGNKMIQLFLENYARIPDNEAEASGTYKEIMLNRELGGRFL